MKRNQPKHKWDCDEKHPHCPKICCAATCKACGGGWKEEQDAGIAKAKAGAPAYWHAEAQQAGIRVAKANETLTTAQIYEEMNEDIRGKARGQAFGSVMRTLVKIHVIESTDVFRNEKLTRNHGRPQRVWRSLLFAG